MKQASCVHCLEIVVHNPSCACNAPGLNPTHTAPGSIPAQEKSDNDVSFSWQNVLPGAALLLAKLDGDNKYNKYLGSVLTAWLYGTRGVTITPLVRCRGCGGGGCTCRRRVELVAMGLLMLARWWWGCRRLCTTISALRLSTSHLKDADDLWSPL